jgi:hypothetical protein
MGYDVATFWVSALQLLVSLYQVAAARTEKARVLIGIQEEIRLNRPEDPRSFIQERIVELLPEAEAAEVQADISTLSLLNIAPIEASAFDYWTVLQTMFSRVREFCHHHSVFRFRGLGPTIGNRILEFPRTSAALFDADTRAHWQEVRYPQHSASRGTRQAQLFLVEKPRRPPIGYGAEQTVSLPVMGNIAAQYINYNSSGYDGPPPVRTEPLAVYVLPGTDVHWVWFRSSEESMERRHCLINFQRMLTAPEVLEIVKGVREDLIAHINGLITDQHFSSTTLRSALTELMAQISTEEQGG